VKGSGEDLVAFVIRLDSFIYKTDYERTFWVDVMEVCGGINAFFSSVILFCLAHFTEIDFMAMVIRHLFLEKQSDKKFFEKFI
jgi:hypothetical protein